MYVLTHYTLCFENPCEEAAHITCFFGILTFIKKPNKTDQGDSLEITNKKPKIDKTKQNKNQRPYTRDTPHPLEDKTLTPKPKTGAHTEEYPNPHKDAHFQQI